MVLKRISMRRQVIIAQQILSKFCTVRSKPSTDRAANVVKGYAKFSITTAPRSPLSPRLVNGLSQFSYTISPAHHSQSHRRYHTYEKMIPDKRLPYSDEFSSEEEYVSSLLEYVSTSTQLQTLCGGVHILDFFTSDPGTFKAVIPSEWQSFLLDTEPMALLNFLLHDDLSLPTTGAASPPPDSLITYAKEIRRLRLGRAFTPTTQKLPVLPRHIRVGMSPKKIHEVTNFAGYIDRLVDSISASSHAITHLIDFGSGKNYLGRTLASPPYGRHVVAVESQEHIVTGARDLDVQAGLAEKEKVLRNKKLWVGVLDRRRAEGSMDEKAVNRRLKGLTVTEEEVRLGDLRPRQELEQTYLTDGGKGAIHYVEGRLETGDLEGVLDQVKVQSGMADPALMAVSIHSCGNLSHYGIRSMILNPDIKAVAIVGCCYNLLTERLGPPTHKLPGMRPTLQPVNGRVYREAERRDPQGYPLSKRVAEHNGGIRLNITARMMACQAPENWTEKESKVFFTRHLYRAMLQKLLLDKGVISKVHHDRQPGENGDAANGDGDWKETPFNTSTNPVIIGSLRKPCFASFTAYVRGAIAKLTTSEEHGQYAEIVAAKLGGITDEEIASFEENYGVKRGREISSVWSLMAFSAGVVESLIVVDRWLFLKEHSPDVVKDAWVETVFEYGQSPRNLVVVGVKS